MNSRIEKYLNYVIDDLISNTEIKKLSPVTGPFISYPWNNVVLQATNKSKRLLQYDTIPYQLIKHLNNSYGLEMEEQMDYVWENYKDFLTDLLYNKN